MKKLLSLVCIIFMISSAIAQEELGEKIKEKAKEKVEEKENEAIDEAAENAENAIKDAMKKKEKKDVNQEKAQDSKSLGTSQEEFKSYSKFDFVPGEQVIYFEDFSQDAVGDFPAKWNTTVSGEVVTISNTPGKWLRTVNEAWYIPEIKSKTFPENLTIECDVIFKFPEESSTQQLLIDIFSSSGAQSNYVDNSNGGGRFTIGSNVLAADNFTNEGGWLLHSDLEKDLVGKDKGKVFRVSIWIQKQRGRLYIDETKVFDLPKFLPEGLMYSHISFFSGLNGEDREIFFSNIRVAAGAPDMRSKLLTEGKLITRGILFDVNSDKIKPESYGTLKEIAAVLKENPSVKVKIVGHTDSDGDDKSNMELSKKRAASVKNSLTKDFGIKESRMQSDGKGESEPVSPNTTPEGKANNRRVEFIKL